MTAARGAAKSKNTIPPTVGSGSGTPAKPSSKTCADCDQPTYSPRATYCEKHRGERRLAQWRRTPGPRPCERCGEMIEKPYKGDQKYHDGCYPDARRDHANERMRAKRDDDPQMDALFSQYDSRQSISITDRPDGTRVAMLSDLQIPFVDERLYKAVLQFLGDFRPHDIIWNGDILDFYGASVFDTNPTRKFGIKQEIERAENVLYDASKRLAVGGQQWWIDGNHEDRLRRYIWRNSGELAEIVPDLDELLHLDQHCEGSVPYGKHIDYLGFVVTHGNFVSAFSAYTARRHADRYHSSGANGHTHRCGSYSYTDGRNKSHTWYEMGCLCRTDMEYVRGVANWQQGWLIGTVFNGALHPQLIRVIDYEDGTRGFFANGRHYEV